MNELKPCPFCGGQAEEVDPLYLQCSTDGCVLNCAMFWINQYVWNTRPIEDTLRECIEDAKTVIERGIELMPLDQLSEWEGVRAWLVMAPYTQEMVRQEVDEKNND